MQVIPLRDMVLLAPTNGAHLSKTLTVIAPERTICRFAVVAIGPEVRDVQPSQIVLANRLAATRIGEQFLLPEHAILGVI